MSKVEIKADLHLHTTASDGVSTPEQMYARALQLGLKAIAITDHNTVAGALGLMNKLREVESSLEVVPGVELSYLQGHFLLLGIELPKLEKQLEKWNLPPGSYLVPASYDQMRDALAWSRDQGGLNIAAHPGVPTGFMSLDYGHLIEFYQEGLLHGAEIHNADLLKYFPYFYAPWWQTTVERVVREAGIPAYADSDAHAEWYLGRFHNVFQIDQTRGALVEQLKRRPQEEAQVGFAVGEFR